MRHEDKPDICTFGGSQHLVRLKRGVHDDTVVRFFANQYKDVVAEVSDTYGLDEDSPGVYRFHGIALS
jgi:hypothetical protein